jgi:hypothetical protein
LADIFASFEIRLEYVNKRMLNFISILRRYSMWYTLNWNIQVKKSEMGDTYSTNERERGGTRIDYWWENHREGRPLKRPRRRWVDNIRMDLGEVGWGDVDWIGLAKDRNR